MEDLIRELYTPALREYGFEPDPDNHRYGPNGLCWRQVDRQGEGYYWAYGQKNLFDIKIHDFAFYEDSLLEFRIPRCLSVTYYESISGEELNPYRRLTPGCVKTFLGGEEPYTVLIHKDVPIRSIGIEITPAYYEGYLKRQYPEEYVHPREAFRALDQTEDFPQMVRLLEQVKNYRGEGIAARLFYEGKVAEAVAMVVEHSRARPAPAALPAADRRLLQELTAYLDAHCGEDLPREQLARMACMSPTKLKRVFRQYHGCTITEYLRRLRMRRAEQLLAGTELTVGQVARQVGYQSASRFAAVFRQATGQTPAAYRRGSRG